MPNGQFDVTVELSRIERVTITFPVEADNPTAADAVGRTVAREVMDGRRPFNVAAVRYLPWFLDDSTVTRSPS